MKFGSNKQVSRRTTRESNGGTMAGVRKSGSKRPAQFSEKTPGNREVGFKVKTQKQATAAMQGRPPQGGATKADAGPRSDAKRQFGKAPGKAVF